MLDFVYKFSNDLNAHRINEKLILEFRKNDDMVTYLDEVNKELERILPFVKYKGYSYNDTVRKMRNMQDAKADKVDKKNNKVNEPNNNFPTKLPFKVWKKLINVNNPHIPK